LLPVGVHDCTLAELKSRFGSFQIEYDEAVAFFQQVRHEPALRKGILKLRL
jgi:hypothetical protein